MATTTKITLSVDSVALSLAQRAAELSGLSVSAVVSEVLRRHLLTDYGPPPGVGAEGELDEERAGADLELADLAENLERDQRWGRRAAG
ncbi:MAG: hypothetical protein ACRDTF_04845 [Pseudonocardiaceae bacterium]